MQKNIIDIKSQKLKQHQISLSSRNDLLLRENDSKPGITPLKHFNFTFQAESADDLEAPKSLSLTKHIDNFYEHKLGAGPAHQVLRHGTDKCLGQREISNRQLALKKYESARKRHSLFDNMHTTPGAINKLRESAFDRHTPDYQSEAKADFKLTQNDFVRQPLNTMTRFGNFNRGSITTTFGGIKRGSYPIEGAENASFYRSLNNRENSTDSMNE